MNKLVLVLVALVVVIYLRYYLSSNPEFQIIQASLDRIQPKHLFEKNPVIIEEQIVDPLILLNTLFKYLYTFKRVSQPIPNVFLQNKFKFCIIWPTTTASDVKIMHPRDRKKEKPMILDIKLKRNQCLILPLHWWYKTNGDAVFNRVTLDDMISLILGKL